MSNSVTPEPGTERTLRSAVRNPRRRQRNDSDSVKLAPRRKRSKISEEAFAPREDGDMNGDVVVNGYPTRDSVKGRKASGTPMQELDMPVRGKKGTVKRVVRGDGATTLTQNANYSVKMLPSTPKELRRPDVEYRGSLSTTTSQALAITREQAYIWDYTSHTSVSSPKVFEMPWATKKTDPLPCGALVKTGASTELGLVLVSATTGKVVFHESVERAASMGLFQERKAGVEGSLGSLFSGESVVALADAESAGFIVTFSSGRIAQLTLRDTQGRPHIQTQFLRAHEPASGGIFGSIKGLLGAGAWKRDVAAVYTRALGPRGQMQVISMTESAVMQVWDLDWSGRYNFRSNIDFSEPLIGELKAIEPPETQGRVDQFAVLDFAILDKAHAHGIEVATIGTDKPLDLLALVRIGPIGYRSYSLVELNIMAAGAGITQVLPLPSYQETRATDSKPRLLVPRPGHTAYAIFDDAIAISVTSGNGSDPDAQLHEASYIAPEPFHDTVYLRKDKGLAFLGGDIEESRSGQALGVAFVKGLGLVRISAHDASKDVDLGRIPAKSRIEQAVFYGILQESILDLGSHGTKAFTQHEVERAALAISDEILRSQTQFIPTSPTSIDTNLARRAQALQALVSHLKQAYPPLTKKTMWQLLWDAEKIAAGQKLWQMFELHLVEASKEKKRRSTLLHEVCALLQSFHPFELPENAGQDDQVRTVFVTQLAQLERILPIARQAIKDILDDGTQSAANMLRLVSEADDLWLGCLETVFAFRSENASLYGILPESMDDGVLIESADYEDLPEFWTSSETMLKEVVKTTELTRKSAADAYEMDSSVPEVYVKKVAQENARLVQLSCLIYQEQINWSLSRGSHKYQDRARKMKETFESVRYNQIRSLSEVGQTEAGLKLAERYHDMTTLTEMIVGESQYLLEHRDQEPGQKVIIDHQLREIHTRVGRYFDRYGDEWANAFFDEGFSGSRAGHILGDAQQHWGKYLTRYLSAKPSRAKICWINDVGAEKDYAHAGKVLTQVATERENNIWSKKVELSMAKLAILAAHEEEATVDETVMEAAKSNLKIVDVQETLYKHLYIELVSSLDEESEIINTLGKVGNNTKNLASLHQLLEASLSKLISHQTLSLEELIDVLTLMDSVSTSDEDANIFGQEFYLALVALNAAAPTLPQKRYETLLQLIWKRAFLADDWVKINSASSKRSEADIHDILTATTVYRTLHNSLSTGLISVSAANHSTVRALTPSECVSAGCSPQHFSYRFPAELLDPIVHDNKIQDQTLLDLINDRRLEHWFEDVMDLAKNSVMADTDREAEKNQIEREVERQMQNGGHSGMNGNGHGGMNGHGNGIKLEDGEEDEEISGLYYGEGDGEEDGEEDGGEDETGHEDDDDEDVEME